MRFHRMHVLWKSDLKHHYWLPYEWIIHIWIYKWWMRTIKNEQNIILIMHIWRIQNREKKKQWIISLGLFHYSFHLQNRYVCLFILLCGHRGWNILFFIWRCHICMISLDIRILKNKKLWKCFRKKNPNDIDIRINWN